MEMANIHEAKSPHLSRLRRARRASGEEVIIAQARGSRCARLVRVREAGRAGAPGPGPGQGRGPRRPRLRRSCCRPTSLAAFGIEPS